MSKHKSIALATVSAVWTSSNFSKPKRLYTTLDFHAFHSGTCTCFIKRKTSERTEVGSATPTYLSSFCSFVADRDISRLRPNQGILSCCPIVDNYKIDFGQGFDCPEPWVEETWRAISCSGYPESLNTHVISRLSSSLFCHFATPTAALGLGCKRKANRKAPLMWP